MANVFDQFDAEPNVFDQFDDVPRGTPEGAFIDPISNQEVSAAPDMPPVPGGRFMTEEEGRQRGITVANPDAVGQPLPPERGIVDMFTGESMMTPQMRNLPEIGQAPELNEMSVPAFKAAFGLMTTGDTESLKGILSQQYQDKVSFEQDSKGNIVVNFPSGQYALNTPGLSGQDLASGAMDFISYLPASKAASIPAAIAKNAATEAVLEGGEAAVGGDFTAQDVALSGGLGGTFKLGENVLGSGYRALFGKGDDTIVQAGKDSGIPVLTTDVLPPKTFAAKTAQQTGEKIPVAGTGGIRQAQQEMREQAVSDVSEKYSQFSYSDIVESLKTQKGKVKKAAGDVLEKIGVRLDKVGVIPMTNTAMAIEKANAILTKPGVMKSTGALHDTPDEILDNLKRTMDESPQTFTTLKENRTAFREIVKGADKAERSQMTSRGKAALQSVESAMKKDMDSFAKTNLTDVNYSAWQQANKRYAEEAINMTKTRLKNVLDKGDVTPENVSTMLFSKKPSEVRLLYKSLTDEGRANARSAIISKVISDLNSGASTVTPNSFATSMNKMGLQVDEFFKGEEKRMLNGLIKVLNSTRRAQDAAITTPTGQQMIGAGTLAAMAVDPISTIGIGGTLGSFSRLYESAPVRNALLRLDSIPKGSTRYDKALAEVISILTAGAQTAREQTQGMQ